MKDQCENLNLARPADAMEFVKTTQAHMDGILNLYSTLATRNGKLKEIIEIQAKFYDSFYKFNGCLDEIISNLEDLHPDEFLTPWDAKDKGEIDNAPALFGDV